MIVTSFECHDRVSLAQILTDPAGDQAFAQDVPGYLSHSAICRALTESKIASEMIATELIGDRSEVCTQKDLDLSLSWLD